MRPKERGVFRSKRDNSRQKGKDVKKERIKLKMETLQETCISLLPTQVQIYSYSLTFGEPVRTTFGEF